MLSRRRLRRMFKSGPIGHTAKGVAYRIGNSFRGLRWMKRAGKKKADRDLQITKDGVWVVCHWGRPLAKDDFEDPQHKIPRNARVREMTWAEVSRLTSPGGYKIHTLAEDLRICGQLGIEAKLEPKNTDRRFRDQAAWNNVKATADRYHCKVSGYALRPNAGAVLYMRRAGIPATVIR